MTQPARVDVRLSARLGPAATMPRAQREHTKPTRKGGHFEIEQADRLADTHQEHTMPAPDQKHENQRGHAMAKDIMERLMSPTPESQLAHEVAELRREIQALRQDLAPVPGLILTGRAALDEFKRLTQGA